MEITQTESGGVEITVCESNQNAPEQEQALVLRCKKGGREKYVVPKVGWNWAPAGTIFVWGIGIYRYS